MTKDELFNLMSRFAQRPLPAVEGRHVYLWHGSLELLKRGVPVEILVQLDLHHLATTLPRAPQRRDEARRLLSQAINAALNEHKTEHQQIFVVTGCDLLSRYEVPLTPFFQVASERQMVILVAPLVETYFQPSHPLPGYVVLDPTAPFNYLKALVGLGATVNAPETPPS